MMRWNKVDIPHKGWKYIGMEDLGEDVLPGDPCHGVCLNTTR